MRRRKTLTQLVRALESRIATDATCSQVDAICDRLMEIAARERFAAGFSIAQSVDYQPTRLNAEGVERAIRNWMREKDGTRKRPTFK